MRNNQPRTALRVASKVGRRRSVEPAQDGRSLCGLPLVDFEFARVNDFPHSGILAHATRCSKKWNAGKVVGRRECRTREDGRSLRSRCDFPARIPAGERLPALVTPRCRSVFVECGKGSGPARIRIAVTATRRPKDTKLPHRPARERRRVDPLTIAKAPPLWRDCTRYGTRSRFRHTDHDAL